MSKKIVRTKSNITIAQAQKKGLADDDAEKNLSQDIWDAYTEVLANPLNESETTSDWSPRENELNPPLPTWIHFT